MRKDSKHNGDISGIASVKVAYEHILWCSSHIPLAHARGYQTLPFQHACLYPQVLWNNRHGISPHCWVGVGRKWKNQRVNSSETNLTSKRWELKSQVLQHLELQWDSKTCVLHFPKVSYEGLAINSLFNSTSMFTPPPLY